MIHDSRLGLQRCKAFPLDYLRKNNRDFEYIYQSDFTRCLANPYQFITRKVQFE